MIHEFPKYRYNDDRIFIDLSKIINIESNYSDNDVFTIKIEFQLREKPMIIQGATHQYMTEEVDNKYAKDDLDYKDYFNEVVLNPLLKAWNENSDNLSR